MTVSTKKGTVLLSVARGATLAALGHATLSHGRASVSMRELRRITRGAWTVTVVLTETHAAPRTTTARLRIS